jgi:hypothetical protein
MDKAKVLAAVILRFIIFLSEWLRLGCGDGMIYIAQLNSTQVNCWYLNSAVIK